MKEIEINWENFSYLKERQEFENYSTAVANLITKCVAERQYMCWQEYSEFCDIFSKEPLKKFDVVFIFDEKSRRPTGGFGIISDISINENNKEHKFTLTSVPINNKNNSYSYCQYPLKMYF